MKYLTNHHSDSLLTFARSEYARWGPGSIFLSLTENDLASGTLAPFELIYGEASMISKFHEDSSKYDALVAGTNPEIEFTLFITIERANSDMSDFYSFKITPNVYVPTDGSGKA